MVNIKNFSLILGNKKILHDICLDINGSLSIIGESGAGKSSLASAIFNHIKYKEIKVKGRVAMIFQDSLSYLNPTMSIFSQIFIGAKVSMKREKEIVESLNLEELFNKYPHQLSAGQRQRVIIAIALMLSPNILIADEATTFLDKEYKNAFFKLIKGINVIFITHDINLAKQISSRAIVLRDGKLLEDGNIFANPQNKYTKELLQSSKWFDY